MDQVRHLPGPATPPIFTALDEDPIGPLADLPSTIAEGAVLYGGTGRDARVYLSVRGLAWAGRAWDKHNERDGGK